jgi:translin
VAPERADELARLAAPLQEQLAAVNAAREVALPACRRTIRASSRAIRAVHRQQFDDARGLIGEAKAAIQEAQRAVEPHPMIAFAGFLHDAEKEYVEAEVTLALVAQDPLPSAGELGVQPQAWFNGVAEAASELRRHALDRLRAGELDRAEQLLSEMDDVYDLLVTIDEPDAVTGGLRRTTDALRAVLERTRADLTLTAVQARLQRTIEGAAADR